MCESVTMSFILFIFVISWPYVCVFFIGIVNTCAFDLMSVCVCINMLCILICLLMYFYSIDLCTSVYAMLFKNYEVL